MIVRLMSEFAAAPGYQSPAWPKPAPQWQPGQRVVHQCLPPLTGEVVTQRGEQVLLRNATEGEWWACCWDLQARAAKPQTKPVRQKPTPPAAKLPDTAPAPEACCLEATERRRGLCSRCYTRWRLSVPRGRCAHPGCGRGAQSGGLCRTCYRRENRASQRALAQAQRLAEVAEVLPASEWRRQVRGAR